MRGVSWVGFGHVVSQVAWFGSLLFIAAIVPPGDFGTVAIAMVIVQIAWQVVGPGTRGSIVVAPTLRGEHVVLALAVNLAAGVGLGVGIALLAGPLLDVVTPGADPDVLRALALSIPLYALSVVPLAVLQRELMFRRHATVLAGSAILGSVGGVVAGVLGADVWALVVRQMLFQTLLAVFAWVGVRRLLPRITARSAAGALRPQNRQPHALGFFVLGVVGFLALNVDYIVVGRVTDVEQLGLYSLAFTIAFAPMTQVAWQIGKVLFPATAATSDPGLVASRMLKATSLGALALYASVPPAVALAPAVLPGLLGEEWEPMVVPFQILLAVGVTHALLAIVREFLLGAGHVAYCARVEAARLVVTVVALLVLVDAEGIRGAALAHVLVLVPVIAVYALTGLPRIGVSPSDLARPLGRVGVPLAGEAVATASLALALAALGVEGETAAACGGIAGLAVFGLILWRMPASPLQQARALVGAARGSA